MRTIAEIIGGAQALLPLNYEIQEYFEETLTKEKLGFIHHIRVLMEHVEGGALTLSIDACKESIIKDRYRIDNINMNDKIFAKLINQR